MNSSKNSIKVSKIECVIVRVEGAEGEGAPLLARIITASWNAQL